jgi:hypothetical protein
MIILLIPVSVAILHVLVKIRTIDSVVENMLDYARRMYGNDKFNKIGRIIPIVYSGLIYIYIGIFIVILFIISLLSIIAILIGWVIWLYGNLILYLVLKNHKWKKYPLKWWGEKEGV